MLFYSPGVPAFTTLLAWARMIEGVMMTLKEISELAGCSISTVSRVLSDHETKAAGQEVKERIWSIVRETGYTPNSNAQNLRRSKKDSAQELKHSFACVFARSTDSTDLFFSELARAIEAEAYKKNYILRCSFYINELKNTTFKRIIGENQIRGIVVLGRFDSEHISSLVESQKNVIYVGLNPKGESKCDTIFSDGYKASVAAVSHLLELGHHKIAYIGETEKENRFLGYCDTLKNHQLPLDRSLIINVAMSAEGGYTGANILLGKHAQHSAIFCANDSTAIGVLRALKEHGLNVPADVSVIGIDDVEMSRYLCPMLTTVHIPIKELGCEAAKCMIDRIERGHTLPIRLELPFSISKRETCAPFRK